MLRSWKLSSLFGIGIYIHSTFLLLPLLVISGSFGAEATGAGATLFLLALVGAVFGCVVLHELGHAVMARRFGIRTGDHRGGPRRSCVHPGRDAPAAVLRAGGLPHQPEADPARRFCADRGSA